MKLSCPGSECLIGYAIDQLPGFPVRVRAEFSQLVHCFSYAAAAGGSKGHQRLPGKIAAFQEGMDDMGRNIPPNREPDEYRVVIRHVGNRFGDFRAGVWVIHFHAAAALFVHPVQVGAGIRNGGSDLKQVCARCLCQTFRGLFCRAGCRKIGYQFFCSFQYFSNSLYSSSLTGSHHSLEVSSPGISAAIWENQLSFFAPCQCLTSGGTVMIVPGVSGTGAFPAS